MVAQQDSRRADVVLLSNLEDVFVLEQGAASASKWTVSHDMDTLLFAEIHNLLLRQGGMVLNLIDCRNNSGLGKKLLQVLLAVLY
jgi:hypothetical protein